MHACRSFPFLYPFLNHSLEGIFVDRLRQIIIHACFFTLFPIALDCTGRHGDDGNLPQCRAKPSNVMAEDLCRLVAIHDRHLTVHEYDAGDRVIRVLDGVKVGESFLAIPHRRYGEAKLANVCYRNLLVDRIVFDDENVNGSSFGLRHGEIIAAIIFNNGRTFQWYGRTVGLSTFFIWRGR